MFGATLDPELIKLGQLKEDAVMVDVVSKDPTNKECVQV